VRKGQHQQFNGGTTLCRDFDYYEIE
jgi:hypothetical protein